MSRKRRQTIRCPSGDGEIYFGIPLIPPEFRGPEGLFRKPRPQVKSYAPGEHQYPWCAPAERNDRLESLQIIVDARDEREAVEDELFGLSFEVVAAVGSWDGCEIAPEKPHIAVEPEF